MNQEQKERLNRIIDADAQIRGKMMNEAGETCFIGGLLLAAGVSPKILRTTPGHAGTSYKSCLADAYGLTPNQVDTLMSTNDDEGDREQRKYKLRMLVATF